MTVAVGEAEVIAALDAPDGLVAALELTLALPDAPLPPTQETVFTYTCEHWAPVDWSYRL